MDIKFSVADPQKFELKSPLPQYTKFKPGNQAYL
jgi:hypothetical protein